MVLPVGSAGDETLIVTQPDRPFSAFARLPEGLVKSVLARAGAQLA